MLRSGSGMRKHAEKCWRAQTTAKLDVDVHGDTEHLSCMGTRQRFATHTKATTCAMWPMHVRIMPPECSQTSRMHCAAHRPMPRVYQAKVASEQPSMPIIGAASAPLPNPTCRLHDEPGRGPLFKQGQGRVQAAHAKASHLLLGPPRGLLPDLARFHWGGRLHIRHMLSLRQSCPRHPQTVTAWWSAKTQETRP